MEIIKTEILKQRPGLSANSVETYVSLLSNLHRNLSKVDMTLKWFTNNENKVLKYVETIPKDSTKKSLLSAYFVLTGKAKTHELMLVYAKSVNDENAKNNKSQAQEDNWITQDEFSSKLETLKRVAFKTIMKQKVINKKDKLHMRDLLAIYVYYVIPPRRLLDFTESKIRNIDKSKDNYFDVKSGTFTFNVYKTAKFYGKDEVQINRDLEDFVKVYKFWLKINPSDYLLVDNSDNKLSSSKLTKILNRIFEKNVSVNILRHSFVTEKMDKVSKKPIREVIADMQKLSADMSHSSSMQQEYYKK